MLRLVIGFVMLIAATGATNAQTAEPADYVFTNGKVYTVDKDNSWAEAVARNVKLMSAFGT